MGDCYVADLVVVWLVGWLCDWLGGCVVGCFKPVYYPKFSVVPMRLLAWELVYGAVLSFRADSLSSSRMWVWKPEELKTASLNIHRSGVRTVLFGLALRGWQKLQPTWRTFCIRHTTMHQFTSGIRSHTRSSVYYRTYYFCKCLDKQIVYLLSVIVFAEIEMVSISKKIAAIEDLNLCGL